MTWMLMLAVKSFVIGGGALLLLKLSERRSAADRSLIAHLGLLALLLLPISAIALPTLDVTGPAALTAASERQVPVAAGPAREAKEQGVATSATFPVSPPAPLQEPIDWTLWAYAGPAAALLLLTLIALGRLIVLQSRATVLVEVNWLTALARAQRRMGFKHGTALLTSDDLPSPISWGLMRPVILLNSAAAESHAEAEAIIAHELAHVAHLDWIKLLISRVATALFWFNPLVWLLAREAHQLREEAADDAVLGSDIEDTDYAQLLVGVARHECRGLLIGAHGVAPARNSLARRVKRVLNSASQRAPGGWRWTTAAAFFAAGMAVPVAALNFVPAESSATMMATTGPTQPYYVSSGQTSAITGSASDAATAAIGGAITNAVAASTAAAALHPHWSDEQADDLREELEAREGLNERYRPGQTRIGPDPRALPRGDHAKGRKTLDHVIAMKAVGVTPEYVARMRAAVPHLKLDDDDLIEMRAVGLTPEYVREMTQLTGRRLTDDELIEARALGVNADYVRGMAAAGYGNLSLEDIAEMRAVGVTPGYVEKFRRAGHRSLSAERLVELRALGIEPDDLKELELGDDSR